MPKTPAHVPRGARGEDGRGQDLRASMNRQMNRNLLGDRFLTMPVLPPGLAQLLSRELDIDQQLAYPEVLSIELYRQLFARDAISHRVVSILPAESWAFTPDVFVDKSKTVSPFQKALIELDEEQSLWHFVCRADVLSRVGHFGTLLFGLDDGEDIDQPVPGLDPNTGLAVGGKPPGHKLLFVRAFDEFLLRIVQFDTDPLSPRYGLPLQYAVRFTDPTVSSGSVSPVTMVQTKRVHWTRLLHLADNRSSSEVFGMPAMQPVFNRLLDIRKVLGGSAQMFWRGAFPGYSFENLDPGVGTDDVDQAALQKQLSDYESGLRRYLALVGFHANSLAPQVADPSKHLEEQYRAIAMALQIPLRIFMGSEQGHLASSQDSVTWNRRVNFRRHQYLNPMVIRPCLQRLQAYGCLPESRYKIVWPDLNTMTDKDRADIAQKTTVAMTQFRTGDLQAMMQTRDFYVNVLGYDEDLATEIADRAGSDKKLRPMPVAPASGPARAGVGVGTKNGTGGRKQRGTNATGKLANKVKLRRAA